MKNSFSGQISACEIIFKCKIFSVIITKNVYSYVIIEKYDNISLHVKVDSIPIITTNRVIIIA
jgi:hypothetical protein